MQGEVPLDSEDDLRAGHPVALFDILIWDVDAAHEWTVVTFMPRP
jgi:hypothetical protein